MRRAMPLAAGAVLRAACATTPTRCCACREPAALELCRACLLEADIESRLRRCGPGDCYRLGRYGRMLPGRAGRTGGATAVARALARFKYGGDRFTGHRLARLFGRYVVSLARRYDLVVPVPLHPRRLRQRGFNQAAWLARAASHTLRTPLRAGALHRTLEGSAQAKLGAAERRRMAEGVFVARARVVRGAQVLLVDDVLTTGSTAAAAAAGLAAAGAAGVGVAVLLVADRVDDEALSRGGGLLDRSA